MTESRRLESLTSWNHEAESIENVIRAHAKAGRNLKILEAGCGRKWDIGLTGLSYSLTGVDLDGAALALRQSQIHDLDDIIEGDLRTVDLGGRKFDVIYNSYVLEHVAGAEKVLQNFVEWLDADGVVILKIPDPDTVKGFFTKFTPHRFHIVYYRHFLGVKTAGRLGYMPYPTYFDAVVSRAGIHQFCKEHGLALVKEYANGLAIPGRGIRRAALRVFSRIVSVLSFGKLSDAHQNLLFVLQRRSAS